MLSRILKVSIVGLIWTYLYVRSTQLLFIYAWNFDYFSASSWQKIFDFWNSGGTIKKGKDYLFLFSLLMLIPIWLIGWRILFKINFLSVLILPITLYNDRIIRKYGASSKRIILKNMGVSIKTEDDVKSKLEAIKPNEWNEANKIRDAVQEKFKKTQK